MPSTKPVVGAAMPASVKILADTTHASGAAQYAAQPTTNQQMADPSYSNPTGIYGRWFGGQNVPVKATTAGVQTTPSTSARSWT